MDYNKFYNEMQNCRLVSNKWCNLLTLLNDEIQGTPNLEEVLKLFVLYFSLIDEGNVYMALDCDKLKNKFKKRIEQKKTEFKENEKDNTDVESSLNAIKTEISNAISHVGELSSLSIIGKDKLFYIDTDKNRLYASKYFEAVTSIIKRTNKLFKTPLESRGSFNINVVVNSEFRLEDKQKDIIEIGLTNNLLITGGPGTGKTTSIMFLLLALLEKSPDFKIYLTAPSAKAAERMNESIKEGLNNLKGDYKKTNPEIIKKIEDSSGKTIHRLLRIDRDTQNFAYNNEHQFEKNSIFIIDEASMIDVCLFSSLLEAIPDGARVFILGDKNQLPSVECGAVFADLLQLHKDNVVELTVAKRFPKDSNLYNMAESVNKGKFTINDTDFFSLSTLSIEDDLSKHEVFYYKDDLSNKDIVDIVIPKWYNKFFVGFQKSCQDLLETDTEKFKTILETSEKAKIICAQNESSRGVTAVNNAILSKYYTGKKISGFYLGEILMVTQNLNPMGLYNGDCGVTVQFKNDETLYFMIEKESSTLNLDEKKETNKIFRIGNYYFYPVRMIGREDISSAFAITIHKSQGSGYNYVLVLLPKTNNHPLLNRQLLYTAITRTQGNVYIISNKENLETASKTTLTRDTGI